VIFTGDWARQGVGAVGEGMIVPGLALLAAAALFGVFLLVNGVDPLEAYELMFIGSFESWFSLQNTLLRSAPLILTALCTALPARLGLVIVGKEGALVVGGVAAAAVAPLAAAFPSAVMLLIIAAAAMAMGDLWIAAAGALRQCRGDNETISGLLLFYIAVALNEPPRRGTAAPSCQPQQAFDAPHRRR
jgi:simple sugar transport system permease protein